LHQAWHEAVVVVAALAVVRPLVQSSVAEPFQVEPFQVEPFRAEPFRAARTWSVPVAPETVQEAHSHPDDAVSVAEAADDRPLPDPAVQTVGAHHSFASDHCWVAALVQTVECHRRIGHIAFVVADGFQSVASCFDRILHVVAAVVDVALAPVRPKVRSSAADSRSAPFVPEVVPAAWPRQDDVASAACTADGCSSSADQTVPTADARRSFVSVHCWAAVVQTVECHQRIVHIAFVVAAVDDDFELGAAVVAF
jgi:hypothetical protein